MLCLGIDPDMHDTAIASWDDLGPVTGHVCSVPRAVTGTDALLAMMVELSKPWPEFGRLEHRTDCQDMPNFCAVEGQESRPVRGRHHARPEDLIHLGNVAGMCVMRVARGYLHGCGLYWPKPSEWKGQVPKQVHQARLYETLGWGATVTVKSSYTVPKSPPASFGCTMTQWKHMGDALLLARWAWEQASGKRWVPR